MRQRFEVPGKLPSLNDYVNQCRRNPYAGAKAKKDAQEAVAWAIRAARLKPMRPPVSVSFTWVEPDMRRDKDNISSAKKYILDALVSQGIIPNDNWRCIAGNLPDLYKVNSRNPRVIVELEETEDEDEAHEDGEGGEPRREPDAPGGSRAARRGRAHHRVRD